MSPSFPKQGQVHLFATYQSQAVLSLFNSNASIKHPNHLLLLLAFVQNITACHCSVRKDQIWLHGSIIQYSCCLIHVKKFTSEQPSIQTRNRLQRDIICIKFSHPPVYLSETPSTAAFSGLALDKALEWQLPFWCRILSNQNYFDEQAVGVPAPWAWEHVPCKRQRLIIIFINFAFIGFLDNDGVGASNEDDIAKLEKLVDLKLNTWPIKAPRPSLFCNRDKSGSFPVISSVELRIKTSTARITSITQRTGNSKCSGGLPYCAQCWG